MRRTYCKLFRSAVWFVGFSFSEPVLRHGVSLNPDYKPILRFFPVPLRCLYRAAFFSATRCPRNTSTLPYRRTHTYTYTHAPSLAAGYRGRCRLEKPARTNPHLQTHAHARAHVPDMLRSADFHVCCFSSPPGVGGVDLSSQHLQGVHHVAVHRALVQHGRARPHRRVAGVTGEALLLPTVRLEQEVQPALRHPPGVPFHSIVF